MKKLLTVIISAVFIFCVAATAYAVIPEIKEGVAYYLNIPQSEPAMLKFVPEESGRYVVYSDSESDTVCSLLNSSMEELMRDDDSGYILNFHLEYIFTAGETYYLSISEYDSSETTAEINVYKACDHADVTEYPAIKPTCDTKGLSAGRYCNDCKTWLTERQEMDPEHTDSDGDYICDLCAKPAILFSVTSLNGITCTLYCCGDLKISGTGVAEENFYTKYDDRVKKIIVSEGITCIDNYYFEYYTQAQSVIFPESLESICNLGYTGEHIKQIDIPKNVNCIKGGALSCKGIEKFTVSPENKYYKTDSYGAIFTTDGKTMVAYPSAAPGESYTVPDGVVSLADELFCNAQNLKEIIIPESVLNIGFYVFDMKTLKNSEKIDGITYLGNILVDFNDFSGDELIIREGTRIVCSSYFNSCVTDIVLPDSLVSLSDFALCDDNDYITELSLPENLRYIGNGALNDLQTDKIYIPASVEYIGTDGLQYEFASVDENNQYYCSDSCGVIYNKDKSELLRFPAMSQTIRYTVADTVRKICDYAFYNCSVRYIELPDGLLSIGDHAFEYCNIDFITIPDTVKTVGDRAFIRSSFLSFYGIKSIVFPASVEKIGDSAFERINAVAILNPECEIGCFNDSSTLIVGYTGSTAQKAAQENIASFSDLDENHAHIYFPCITKYPTCTESGEITYTCPCKASKSATEIIEPLDHPNMIWDDDGEVLTRTCPDCGYVKVCNYGACRCICHKCDDTPIGRFYSKFYKIICALWVMFDIKQSCDCGFAHY